MCLRSNQMEWLTLAALAALAVGLVLPAYPQIVAKLAARGVELSWLGHLSVLALVLLVGLAAVVLAGVVLGTVAWVIERFSRRPHDVAEAGNRGAQPRD